MADNQDSRYPAIPIGVWFKLREEFENSQPKPVTVDYLAAKLNMNKASAKTRLSDLRSARLIDDKGMPTDICTKFRLPATYKQACDLIIEQVYPPTLKSVSPPNKPDEKAALNWFQGLGLGKPRAQAICKFYLALCDGTIQSAAKPTPKQSVSSRSLAIKPQPKPSTAAPDVPQPRPPVSKFEPIVHINLQIHVSKDASLEQIDQVFKSMAKHIYHIDVSE
jgi:hypothetical protein